MGLIIQPTESKKILIDGTEIEVPQVYGRVQFNAMQDGVTMEAQCTIYGSHAAFLEGKFLFTTIGMPVIKVELGNGEMQGTETALSYMAGYLTSQGFEVEVEE
jgi:hypothetical protein